MLIPRVRSLLAGPPVVLLGVSVLIGCSVLTVVLGAHVLAPSAYTVYAAFTGVLGILVLGPASSLEQESALRSSRGEVRVGRSMTRRLAGVWGLITAVSLIPLGWQHRLLGQSSTLAEASLALGAGCILTLGVLRGVGVGEGHYQGVAGSHVIAGLGTLGFPVLLHLAGVGFLPALVAGSVLAWVPALALMGVVVRTHVPGRVSAQEQERGRMTVWLVGANLLVLANLLSVPPLLRWHITEIGTEPAAQAQLLVSMSRLASAAVLGLLPLIMSREARSVPRERPRVLLAATGLGGAALLSVIVVGRPLLSALTGRPSQLPVLTLALAGSAVVALCPAIVLMGVALSQGRYRQVSAAWGGGLLALLLLGAIPVHSVNEVLGGVLGASLVPLGSLTYALVAQRRVPGKIEA